MVVLPAVPVAFSVTESSQHQKVVDAVAARKSGSDALANNPPSGRQNIGARLRRRGLSRSALRHQPIGIAARRRRCQHSAGVTVRGIAEQCCRCRANAAGPV